MYDISERIKAQKAKIKEANRELSRLQDEARKKEDPIEVVVTEIMSRVNSLDNSKYPVKYEIVFSSTRGISHDKIRSAIESLSDKPSEPKSYVDWDKIANGHDWVAIDKYSNIYSYHNKPTIDECGWHSPLAGDWVNITDIVEKLNLPAWDKSLIHRPGAKE